jgi:hypothetical protein
MIDKVGRSNPERIRYPVQPTDGDGPHSGFQATDSLRRGCRSAGSCDIIKRHALGLANFPDARDHPLPP